MGRKKKGKKRRGHYCWVCADVLPNERFSGKGHRRHVCKGCSKLGSAELAYRQHERDIERCLGFDGLIRRKQRKTFERYLTHEDPRVRALAEQVQRDDQEIREMYRQEREDDEVELVRDIVWTEFLEREAAAEAEAAYFASSDDDLFATPDDLAFTEDIPF
jgi:hypothetical protein